MLQCSCSSGPEDPAGSVGGASEASPEARGCGNAMASDSQIRVLLVRTGKTQWETCGRIGGSTDVPLAPAGVDAVRCWTASLAGTNLSTVFCGPDEASRVTATAIASATGAKVKVVDQLAEIHLGLWEGLLEAELQEKCPTAYRTWMEDPACVSAPEGETIEDVRERVLEAVGKIIEKARPGTGAVALVLRPIALAVVSAALGDGVGPGGPSGGMCDKSLWYQTRNGYVPQWRTVSKREAKQVRELAKAPARR